MYNKSLKYLTRTKYIPRRQQCSQKVPEKISRRKKSTTQNIISMRIKDLIDFQQGGD
jgi:hypothetical protein